MGSRGGSRSVDSRQCQMKGRAVVGVCGGPEAPAVPLDDRPADRQTHAEPARLRGVERVEEAVVVEAAAADAPGLHRDDRAPAMVEGLAGWPGDQPPLL